MTFIHDPKLGFPTELFMQLWPTTSWNVSMLHWMPRHTLHRIGLGRGGLGES